jgi:hypothetical protein
MPVGIRRRLPTLLVPPAVAGGVAFDLTSLISHWTLDEASGTRNDSHGANHLTDNNTVTQAAGKIANAGQFTAANSESLSIVDNASLSTGDIDFMITAWVYFDSFGASGQGVVTKDGAGSGNREYGLIFNKSANRLSFLISNDGSSVALVNDDVLGAPATATWYFMVGWHDSVANTINIQVNNGTVGSAAHTTGGFDSTTQLRIGSLSSNINFVDGRIDEVSFWKRILTAAELTTLYNSGAGRAYPWTT